MRSTRTAFAAVLATVVAGFALTMGTAGQAAASEAPSTAVVSTTQDEVPWTGPIRGVIGEAVGVIDAITDGEVPWT
ncbi:hypothetical protein [Streptomyces sp. NPDC086023]|uniref:hypothetical protein n=1 Tax=Streptomyces sp. NPDC086023 TaxID=3365746 RepID=UPI0037CE3762